MKSRKWIGTVLLTLVVVAVLSAGGYALYRYGYARGSMAANSGDGHMFHHYGQMPFLREHMEEFPGRPFRMPGFDEGPMQFRDQYERFEGPGTFRQGVAPHAGFYSPGFRSQRYFSPISIVVKVLFLGFIAWLIYKVITLFTPGKSWQLSFNSQEESEVEEGSKSKRTAKK